MSWLSATFNEMLLDVIKAETRKRRRKNKNEHSWIRLDTLIKAFLHKRISCRKGHKKEIDKKKLQRQMEDLCLVVRKIGRVGCTCRGQTSALTEQSAYDCRQASSNEAWDEWLQTWGSWIGDKKQEN